MEKLPDGVNSKLLTTAIILVTINIGLNLYSIHLKNKRLENYGNN